MVQSASGTDGEKLTRRREDAKEYKKGIFLYATTSMIMLILPISPGQKLNVPIPPLRVRILTSKP